METTTVRESLVDFVGLHGARNGATRGGHRCVPAAASPRALRDENRRFHGSGGVSEENRPLGFRPAFLDTRTQTVHLSRFANGMPAPCHILDGLPDELVLTRDGDGRVATVKAVLVSGFVLDGRFYDREAAARLARRAA